MSWVLIAVIALFVVFGFIGWKQGIIKIVVSLAALIVTVLASILIAPVVYRGIKSATQVDETMQKVAYEIIMDASKKEEKTAKDATSQNGDTSVDGNAAGTGVVEGEPVIDQATQDKMELIEASKGNITKYTEQIASNAGQVSTYANYFIDKMHLSENMSAPLKKIVSEQSIKNMVMNNDIVAIINQTDGSMKSIVVSIASIKLADIVLNAIVHIAVFIVIFVGVRVIVSITGLVSKLPVIKQANKLGGLALGLVEGLIAVWVLFTVITAFGNMTWAADALATIGSNGFLTFLYENNPLVWSIFKA